MLRALLDINYDTRMYSSIPTDPLRDKIDASATSGEWSNPR
jgi:hypothetical protein